MSDRELLLDCISDLRLYIHQRYGLPLKHPAVVHDVPSIRRRTARDTRSNEPAPVQHRDPSTASTLEDLQSILGDCRRCGLCDGRTTIVFGQGPSSAELLIVGEAPGAEEDVQAKPFVGRSGQLLTKMLTAIGLTREQVYITNVVKCRPPQNRNPKAEEVAACAPFLLEQIRLVRPKLLLALGTFAAQTLLQTPDPIMRLRGKSYTYAQLPLIVTLHPAACLYNASNKKYVWKDIKGIPDLLKKAAN